MRKITQAILPTLAVAAIALTLPAAAQTTTTPSGTTSSGDTTSTTTQSGQDTEAGRMTAPLPDESLPEERQGAIGQAPNTVVQGGAGEQDAEPGTAPTGALPDETLAEERGGAIGEDPNAVVQGGAGDLRGADEDAAEGSGSKATGTDEPGQTTTFDKPAAGGGDTAGVSDLHATKVVGKQAQLSSGKAVGTVDDVVLGDDGTTPEEVIIATTGQEIRRVAVPADKVTMAEGDQGLTIDMEDEAFADLPEHEGEAATTNGMDTPKED